MAETEKRGCGVNALSQEIAAMIAENGPISLELYMKLALTHPVHGYYRQNQPIGSEGDFITAPEVHQMFGELIGLWAAEMWHAMGEPAHVLLVELGPGRGTLMADALRAARIVPKFLQAIKVHLVEISEALMASQQRSLSACGAKVSWHLDWDDIPHGPMIVIANEFFDALPVRHYVCDGHGWHERLVGLAPDGKLMFGLAAEPSAEIHMKAEPGTILELGLAARDMMSKTAARLHAERGALLAIDYGYVSSRVGESLQAVRHHRFADPLDGPGEADLTAHVDFAALAHAAQKAGTASFGPVSQGEFLSRLGIFERAAALSQKANETQKQTIDYALDRLVRDGPQTGPRASMADLFKVLAITSPGLPAPPGFEARIA